jgi:meiotic recombination protein SPO11
VLKSQFADQVQLNRVVRDVAASFRVPRHCLNVLADPRGFVAGRVAFQAGERAWVDCLASATVEIPSDSMAVSLQFVTDAKFVLVIEKEDVFARLAASRFYDRVPSIIVTGRGIPDLATRAFVRCLVDQMAIPVLGLVDCDVGGLSVLSCFARGSAAFGMESYKFVIANLLWLGLRPSQISDLRVPSDTRLPLTASDCKVLSKFIKDRSFTDEATTEMKVMLRSGSKYELECLERTSTSLVQSVETMLLRRMWTSLTVAH